MKRQADNRKEMAVAGNLLPWRRGLKDRASLDMRLVRRKGSLC